MLGKCKVIVDDGVSQGNIANKFSETGNCAQTIQTCLFFN